MDKLPPHSNEAENAVIASIILDSECLPKVKAIISRENFMQEKARWVYDAILSLESRQLGIDQLTVFYEMENLGTLEKVGRDSLSKIIGGLPSSVFVLHYARIVKEMSERRHRIADAGRMAQEAYEGKPKPIYKGVKIG